MKKIFLVDDDINLDIGKKTLKHLYDVFLLRSTKMMFEALLHITPDLILLDVEIPGIDEHEAIKKLKSHGFYKRIPIIFLTAKEDEQSIKKCFELGAVDYVHKPFDKDLLISRIEKHINCEDA